MKILETKMAMKSNGIESIIQAQYQAVHCLLLLGDNPANLPTHCCHSLCRRVCVRMLCCRMSTLRTF